MLRWVSERLDDAMFPMLKLVYRGYRDRLAPYRPVQACDPVALRSMSPAAGIELEERPAWRGFAAQEFRFPSPVTCGCDPNRTVSGLLLTVDRDAPWTLVIPGFATGALPPYDYSLFQRLQGRMLLERSVNVALLDLPFHRGRKQPGCGSGEGFFTPDLQQTAEAFVQAAGDSIALLRWLQERSGAPAGVWGTSLGGGVAGLVGAHMEELGALALMEPLDNPGDTLAVLPGSWEIREALRENGVTPEEVLPALLRPVAPSTYTPALAKERILFATPLWDRVIPARFQEAFWQAWGRPERIVMEAGHVTMAPNRALNARIADFLAGWIRGPAR